jgi:hypothetical protein
MLARVWQELYYHVDVCCVTGGAHIEHLWMSVETWESFAFMLYLHLWNKFITAVTAMFSFCTILNCPVLP